MVDSGVTLSSLCPRPSPFSLLFLSSPHKEQQTSNLRHALQWGKHIYATVFQIFYETNTGLCREIGIHLNGLLIFPLILYKTCLLLMSSAKKCIRGGAGLGECLLYLLIWYFKRRLLLVDPEGAKLSRRSGKKLSDRSGQQEGLRAKAITWNPNKEFMVMWHSKNNFLFIRQHMFSEVPLK